MRANVRCLVLLINQWALSNNLITLLGFWNESAVICSRYTWMGLRYKLYWYKDHEREFVFGKNDFENALLLLDTFFIEAYFCIIYSTQDIIILDQRQYIFMHYIVFLSASINGFGDYYYYELYICESERIPWRLIHFLFLKALVCLCLN